jgi:hypothetical protein
MTWYVFKHRGNFTCCHGLGPLSCSDSGLTCVKDSFRYLTGLRGVREQGAHLMAFTYIGECTRVYPNVSGLSR